MKTWSFLDICGCQVSDPEQYSTSSKPLTLWFSTGSSYVSSISILLFTVFGSFFLMVRYCCISKPEPLCFSSYLLSFISISTFNLSQVIFRILVLQFILAGWYHCIIYIMTLSVTFTLKWDEIIINLLISKHIIIYIFFTLFGLIRDFLTTLLSQIEFLF